ncbi:hypothetical protein [Candidatus Avelusimicrobium caledoniensis]|uniref:hypothetical protein n=1 Tax=Candidatus Avelusimicrobium caledoniensis TaxID=3416220 RepID=UPI003D0AC285
MRKLFLSVLMGFILLATLSAAAGAQVSHTNLQRNVFHTARQAQEKFSSNSNALEKNITASFTLRGGKLERHPITNNSKHTEDDSVEQVTVSSSVSCKAYALDEHWLILAGTCMQAIQNNLRTKWHNIYGDREAFEIQLSEGFFSERTIGLITEKGLIDDIKTHTANNNHVMLIWNDSPKYRAPFVNVLAIASPYWLAFLQEKNNQLKIHTARFGTNNTYTRTVKYGTISENKFSLDESWYELSGTYTDPLFLINAVKNEFLAGYNDAVQFYQTTSDKWYSLSYVDLVFIKDTVQKNRPQDWQRIKTRLFYNNLEKPCFD